MYDPQDRQEIPFCEIGKSIRKGEMLFLLWAVLMLAAALAVFVYPHYYVIRLVAASPDVGDQRSLRERVARKVGWPQVALISLGVLVLPSGGAFQVFLLHYFGYCQGGLGSGVSCGQGGAGYFGELSMIVEFGMLLGYTYIWLIGNAVVLVIFILSCLYSIRRNRVG